EERGRDGRRVGGPSHAATRAAQAIVVAAARAITSRWPRESRLATSTWFTWSLLGLSMAGLLSGGLKTHASATRIPHRARSRHSGPAAVSPCPGQAARRCRHEEVVESWLHDRPCRLRACFAPVPERYGCNISVRSARARGRPRFRGTAPASSRPR